MASAGHRGVKFLKLGEAGRWVVRWRDPVTGKQVQRDCEPLGLTNADLRRRWAVAKRGELQKLRAALELGGNAGLRVTIADSQAAYIASAGAERTRMNRKPALDSIAEHLKDQGMRQVQDITAPALVAWANHVRRPANPHAIGTRNQHLAVAAAWLRSCRELGQLPRVTPEDIATACKRQKAPRDPIAVLRPAQVRDVLRACLAHDEAEGEALAPLVLLTLLTGMRYAEAAELDWSEVDVEGKAIRLPAGRTKTATARTVTLAECPSAVELLGALRLRRSGLGRVFRLDRDDAERMRRRSLRSYTKQAWDWRQLRRTCGSVLVCAGLLGDGSAFLAAKRLGHSVAISERHYLGTMTDLPRDAKTIEQALGIEAEAKAIVRAVTGVTASAARQAN